MSGTGTRATSASGEIAAREGGSFDSWANLPSSWNRLVQDPGVTKLFGERPSRPYTLRDLTDSMRQNGVEGGLLTGYARELTPTFVPSYTLTDGVFHQICEEVASVVRSANGVFAGSIVLDPRLGYAASQHVRKAVESYGMRAVRIVPAQSLLAIDDALCFPLYTAACDLGVPVTVNVGAPGPAREAHYQHPMLIDKVALAFPKLMLVMTHVGYPWIDEVISLLTRHENVFMMTSGWAPQHVPRSLVEFAARRDPTKLLWASDWPVLPLDRTASEGRELDLGPEALHLYMGANGRRLFMPEMQNDV
jgi:predicted TIM-barrel fold metal-dependent hydrolase